MELLNGKRILILGVANERSLAWGMAEEFKAMGARLALTYQGDALKKRVIPLADKIGAEWTCDVDVTDLNCLKDLRDQVEKEWGQIDVLVHSVAFADRADLKGRFIETSAEGFSKAMNISAYSLVSLCNSLEGLMSEGGSVMAMSYHGSQKIIKNYNVMGVAKAALEACVRYLSVDLGDKGIRINAISAGPVKTLASSAVSGLKTIFDKVELEAPMKRNITKNDVGKMATFLASDLSENVTGQILYVDSGLSTLGL